MHFNAIAGLDCFRDVAMLISIGRPLPSSTELEALAARISIMRPPDATAERAPVSECVVGQFEALMSSTTRMIGLKRSGRRSVMTS